MVQNPYFKAVLVREQSIFLLSERAAFWPEKGIMLIADVHFGKIQHFRKAGIGVPADAAQQNIEMLSELISQWPVTRLIFLGDLFHSQANQEYALFEEWLDQNPDLKVELVRGNHDGLSISTYHRPNKPKFLTHDFLHEPPFYFTHEPPKPGFVAPDNAYIWCGHIHPCYVLSGKGRQFLRLCCFYLAADYGILPAFGVFTGTADMKKTGSDRVFVIGEDRVFEV